MGKTNYLKILYAVLFLAFGVFSCWATAESLYLTWPDISIVFCYVISIGLFLVASMGFSMIAKSFNRNEYVQNRGKLLLGGCFIIVVFWLLFCMPTNTHTFLYRNVASATVENDIQTTQKYLNDIATNQDLNVKCEQEKNNYKNKVKARLENLRVEIFNKLNDGIGPIAKQKMYEIAKLLDDDELEPPSTATNNMSEQQRIAYFNQYSRLVNTILDEKLKSIDSRYEKDKRNIANIQDGARERYKILGSLKEKIALRAYDVNNAEDLDIICTTLTNGYTYISNNKGLVTFNDKVDEARYTSKTEPLVKHVSSVFALWKDFLTGEYAGNNWSVVFFIFLSILVDFAAFIFFSKLFQ